VALAEWQSYHIFYSDNLDTVVCGLIAPLVTELYKARSIRSAFFLRHDVGGSHVRLRLEVSLAHESAVRATVLDAAASFLHACPSLKVIDDDVVRRRNAGILAVDPHAGADTVYSNNTVVEIPFEPEYERYGGPLLLPSSLWLFGISSMCALSTLCLNRHQSRRRQVAAQIRLLVRFTKSITESHEAMVHLLRHHLDRTAPQVRRTIEDRCQGEYCGLDAVVRDELHSASNDVGLWSAIGSTFRSAIVSASDRTVQRLYDSHLHMLANRLGFTMVAEYAITAALIRSVLETKESPQCDTAAHPNVSEVALMHIAATQLRAILTKTAVTTRALSRS